MWMQQYVDAAAAHDAHVRADGSIDSTHFQERGANILAGLVAASVESLKLPLASLLN
jgi:hypothetical protein